MGTDAKAVTPEAVAGAQLIDPWGRLRAFLDGDTFDPQDLVTDVRALAPQAHQ